MQSRRYSKTILQMPRINQSLKRIAMKTVAIVCGPVDERHGGFDSE
jgi:hypothetical protein